MTILAILVAVAIVLIGWKIIAKGIKAWKKADVDQKLEDIETNEELYTKTVGIDIEEVKAEKKQVDEIKDLDV